MERNKEIRVAMDTIRYAMRVKGIPSLRALAQRCKMGPTTIYNVEASGRASWQTLARIAAGLGVEPQDIAIDDVSGYGQTLIKDLDSEGVYLIVSAIVRETMRDYQKAYRAVLKDKDPLRVNCYTMAECMKSIREWMPDHADAIEEHMREEVENEKRKKVFGRDPDAPPSR